MNEHYKRTDSIRTAARLAKSGATEHEIAIAPGVPPGRALEITVLVVPCRPERKELARA